jgi:hypothetical protein
VAIATTLPWISRRMKPSPILIGMRNSGAIGEPPGTRKPDSPAPMAPRQGIRGANLREPLASGLPGLTPTLPERFSRRRLAAGLPQTGPDIRFVPGGQGVAGSNPAVPTIA